MTDATDDPTEPTPEVEEPAAGAAAEAATPAEPAPAGGGGWSSPQTVTRKAAVLGLAGAFLVGGLVGWIGSSALGDDDTDTDTIGAVLPGGFPGGGRGGFPGGDRDQGGGWGGVPGGPHRGVPGGELPDELQEQLDEWMEEGRVPPWMDEDHGDRGDHHDGYDDEDDQDQDQDRSEDQDQSDDA